MEMGTLDGIIGCVSAGIGIAMLPRAVMQSAVDAGQVSAHALADGAGLATTVFVRRKNDYLSGTLRSFIDNARPCATASGVHLDRAAIRMQPHAS
jgi:DNA-binding transcriptional LysR family regulator